MYTEIQYLVNTNEYIKLKDIIEWCNKNQSYALSEKLLSYIIDKNFDNLEKEYKIVRIPYFYYLKNKIEEDYIRYIGYSLVEKNDSNGMV